jgi:hypothetical protein
MASNPAAFINKLEREVRKLSKESGLAVQVERYDSNKTLTVTVRVPRPGVVVKKAKVG